MLEFATELFSDYTARTIISGAASLGIVSGVVGSYAVLRKQSLVGDVMSHAALPGIVLAFIAMGVKEQIPIFVGAVLSAILAVFLINLVTANSRIKTDSAMGMALSVFFGLGLVLLTYAQKMPDANQAGLDKFLFGQAEALVEKDVLIIAIVGLASLLTVALFWKEFKLLCFDPDFGGTMGFSMKTLDLLVTAVIVSAIVIGLQTVGVVLMSSMLIAPAVAARQWTGNMGSMVILAAFIATVSGVTGVALSAGLENVPTGPAVIVCVSLIAFFSVLFSPNGFFTLRFKDARSRREIKKDYVLKALHDLALEHDDPGYAHSRRLIALGSGKRFNVERSLLKLQEAGYVENMGQDNWRLTASGIREAAKLSPHEKSE
ncbi:MAG: metal ABC transporter permease [Candidatus Dadabacteria bacterium]|nr:metal ABC transporter permease [Candidatus Dadabacteria bacterium]MCY4262675.1 metal ABC transporter permease [Candidatus Dadabacteria bacterium]